MRRASTLLAALALVAATTACERATPPAVEHENARREAYAHTIAQDAGCAGNFNVASTNDIHYVEGFSVLLHDPPDDFHAPAFRWMGQNGRVRLKSHGNRPMHLSIVGWAHEKVLMTRPVVSLYVDGNFIHSTGQVPEGGHWRFDVDVPAPLLANRPWVELRIAVNAVAFHWADPPELRVIVVNELHWTEN